MHKSKWSLKSKSTFPKFLNIVARPTTRTTTTGMPFPIHHYRNHRSIVPLHSPRSFSTIKRQGNKWWNYCVKSVAFVRVLLLPSFPITPNTTRVTTIIKIRMEIRKLSQYYEKCTWTMFACTIVNTIPCVHGRLQHSFRSLYRSNGTY